MLRTENLGFWYQEPQDALYQEVDLNFEAGKMYAILGASGSGKTTFLSLIAGLDTPKEGTIYYEEQPLSKIGLRNYRKNDVSIIFQAYNLLPYLSALDNVLTAMEITKTKQSNYRQVALDRLARVGIDEALVKKPVTKLSGGQQQRVAIVRAICCEHQLIVADEPTGNLDEATSQDIVHFFQEIAHEQNRCIIIVTHEMDVARRCDEIFELKNKKFERLDG
ncbi:MULTISPECIES: ABC transporter ATP-binding protein [unclassified Enterococcus]|uniref:ABC transporter ATP-binding protein n=1 Tax=unclassified Enterococcus TaxID=2608891 RepID=UPI0013EBAC1B|nr:MULTISPECIES: ABC transporter ATP-binding protein [unclassified Enterococcus]